MDLEKAYHMFYRLGSWYTADSIRMYGVGGKLLAAFRTLFVDSRVCVRVKMDVCE